MKWLDKRPVCMLSSRHTAVQSKVKNNYLGQPVIKPVIIQDYNQKMGSVDQTNNFLANYQTLKSIKWYRKLLHHLINMVVLNSYILNKKFGVNKLTHTGYREYIANCLITTSINSSLLLHKTPQLYIENPEMRLTGKHFPGKLTSPKEGKRKPPARRCHVCNFTAEQLSHYGCTGMTLPLKFSCFGCSQCTNVTLCITSCFKIYHIYSNYQEEGLKKWLGSLL